MKFLIVTHAYHNKFKNKYFSYGPYIREMNLWEKHVDELIVIAPLGFHSPSSIDLPYHHRKIKFISIPEFNFIGFKNSVRAFSLLPVVLFKIGYGMFLCDHIHLRCPGNVGLLGCFVQFFFPLKKKTAKYAGNWDPKSEQPLTYRIQRFILNSEFFSKNINVLVYGHWLDSSKNIIPFFTASYFEKDKVSVVKSNIVDKIKLIFVGGLYSNKNPSTALEVCHLLRSDGFNVELSFCGDGPELSKLVGLTEVLKLNDSVKFLGNVTPETVKQEFINSHFLIFVSNSEGWPKVVAEAMWWGCIPITTPVSCVPQMLEKGERGFLVVNNSQEIFQIIKKSIQDIQSLSVMRDKGMRWSRTFTLEKFENEIKNFL